MATTKADSADGDHRSPTATEDYVNAVVDERASITPQRFFTIPGRDPFDEIEWETAPRADPGQGRPGVRSEGRRVPALLVADGDEHRGAEVLPRPHDLARARALGEADDRPRRRHDRRLGPPGRLLRDRRGGRDVRGRAEGDPRQPDRVVQLAGLVQRRLRGEAAVLRLLHPLDRGLDGLDPRLDPPRGRHLPRRLGLGPQPLAPALLAGAALEGRLCVRARSRSCAAPTRRPARSSRAARRAARRRWSCSTSTTPMSTSSSGARRRRSARRACSSRRATTCRSTRPTGARSSTRTRTTRSASPTPSWRRSSRARSGTSRRAPTAPSSARSRRARC